MSESFHNNQYNDDDNDNDNPVIILSLCAALGNPHVKG
jgi:hypothetical protein